MASGEWGVKDTTALIPVIQNVWAPYLTMRHVLLESFVWEEANRVPFLIREFSYDRDPSVLYVGSTSTTVYCVTVYLKGREVSSFIYLVRRPVRRIDMKQRDILSYISIEIIRSL